MLSVHHIFGCARISGPFKFVVVLVNNLVRSILPNLITFKCYYSTASSHCAMFERLANALQWKASWFVTRAFESTHIWPCGSQYMWEWNKHSGKGCVASWFRYMDATVFQSIEMDYLAQQISLCISNHSKVVFDALMFSGRCTAVTQVLHLLDPIYPVAFTSVNTYSKCVP